MGGSLFDGGATRAVRPILGPSWMRFRRGVLALVVGAAVLAAVVATRHGTRDRGSPLSAELDFGRGRGSTELIDDEGRGARSVLPGPSPSERVGSSSGGKAVLVVEVVAMGSGERLPGVRLTLARREQRAGGQDLIIPVPTRPESRAPTVPTEGTVQWAVPAEVPLVINTIPPSDLIVGQEVDVAALLPGERREVRIELETLDALHFWGRVLSLSTRQPIEGARVRVFERGELGASWETRSKHQVLAGNDGLFELVRRWATRSVGRVDAPGYAPALFDVSPGYGSRENALPVYLTGGATVEGRVLDEAGNGVAGLDVRLSTEAHRLWIDEAARNATEAVDLDWRSTTREGGSYRLEDIPSGVPLRAELLRGKRILQHAREPLTLVGGATRALDWHLGAGTLVRGRAEEARTRRPLANQEVWLLEHDPFRRTLRWTELPAATVMTDDEGRFEFERVGSGMWLIGPGPVDSGMLEVAPLAVPVRVPPDAVEVEVSLSVHRGLYIRGVVQGEGSRDCSIHAQFADSGVWFVQQCGDDGSFVLGPLGPGECVLTASAPGRTSSQPVVVQAGAYDVVLSLGLEGGLSGTVTDETGVPQRATISVVPAVAPLFVGGTIRTDDHGRFEVDGWPPGRYVGLAQTPTGLSAVVDDFVVAADGVADVAVVLRPSSKLHVRLATGCEGGLMQVLVEGRVVYTESLRRMNTSVFLPPGATTVRLHSDTRYEQVLNLVEGREVTVVLGGD